MTGRRVQMQEASFGRRLSVQQYVMGATIVRFPIRSVAFSPSHRRPFAQLTLLFSPDSSVSHISTSCSSEPESFGAPRTSARLRRCRASELYFGVPVPSVVCPIGNPPASSQSPRPSGISQVS
ncbi:MAG: hypothetical protein LBT65_07925 [Synergistaceae bacterium]|nr:hypothetical protein [Synergistaceae bacterium]